LSSSGGDDQIFRFFAKVERGVVAVSRTQGKISETPLFEEIRHAEREDVFYWMLPLETYAVLHAARPDGSSRLSPLRFGASRSGPGEGWAWGDRSNVFHDLFAYLKVGVHTIKKATEEVLSGGYPEHVLDLAL